MLSHTTEARALVPRPLLSSLAVGLTALLASLGLMLSAPEGARASATGCSYFSGIGPIQGVPIYNGSYCANLDGSGRYVNYVQGGWSSYGNSCNLNITAEFFDVTGAWYDTRTSPVAYGCGHGGSLRISVYSQRRAGRMCSTLKSNGVRLTSVCHSIY